MAPFVGPSREIVLNLLRSGQARLPMSLGIGVPQYMIDCRAGRWMLIPVQIERTPNPMAAGHGFQPPSARAKSLDEGAPIFESSNVAEFAEWLETWPWPGEPQRERVEGATDAVLIFENVAIGETTTFAWSHDSDAPTAHVNVSMVRAVGATTGTFDVPHELWAEFLDLLVERAKVERKIVYDTDDTIPGLEVPAEVRSAIARMQATAPSDVTAPHEIVVDLDFWRCSVRINDGDLGQLEADLKGEEALKLMSFTFDFAEEFGLGIPR